MRKQAPFVFIAGVGLALLVATAVANLDSSEAVRQDAASGQGLVARVRADADWGHDRRSGWLSKRRVDPASPHNEGRARDDWDTLGPVGRIERVEALLDDYEEQLARTEDAERRNQIRVQALQVLSSARADYFSDDDGQARYLALEAAFEADS